LIRKKISYPINKLVSGAFLYCINQIVVSKVLSVSSNGSIQIIVVFSSLAGTMISHPMAAIGEDGDTRKQKASEFSSNKFFNLIKYLNWILSGITSPSIRAQASNYKRYFKALFRYTPIHLNLCVLGWIGVENSLSSTPIHCKTRGLR